MTIDIGLSKCSDEQLRAYFQNVIPKLLEKAALITDAPTKQDHIQKLEQIKAHAANPATSTTDIYNELKSTFDTISQAPNNHYGEVTQVASTAHPGGMPLANDPYFQLPPAQTVGNGSEAIIIPNDAVDPLANRIENTINNLNSSDIPPWADEAMQGLKEHPLDYLMKNGGKLLSFASSHWKGSLGCALLYAGVSNLAKDPIKSSIMIVVAFALLAAEFAEGHHRTAPQRDNERDQQPDAVEPRNVRDNRDRSNERMNPNMLPQHAH